MLNLIDPWLVSGVNLDTDNLRLTIIIETRTRKGLPCPKCGKVCQIEDHRKERSWRHLDTMQFETVITCRTPRINCPEHGVLSVDLPWTEAYSRFTEMFEKFAIDVILSSKSIKSAMGLLRLSWDQVNEIRERAVLRGLSRRKDEDIERIGIDEKSFLKGHAYVSVLTDLDRRRVLDIVPSRDTEAAKSLLSKVPNQSKVKAIAMDMWTPFMNAAKDIFPRADIVHDKYHISTYLNKAVDTVRKRESKVISKDGNNTLKNTKYLWLSDPNNWSNEVKQSFDKMAIDSLKIGKAWSIKEAFRDFWICSNKDTGSQFFRKWYFWATHSRLKPIIDVAKTLKRHLKGILAYLEHLITNALTEGLNSCIQIIKSNARGFRNFNNYRNAILFHHGKLDLYP